MSLAGCPELQVSLAWLGPTDRSIDDNFQKHQQTHEGTVISESLVEMQHHQVGAPKLWDIMLNISVKHCQKCLLMLSSTIFNTSLLRDLPGSVSFHQKKSDVHRFPDISSFSFCFPPSSTACRTSRPWRFLTAQSMPSLRVA